jgi:hypothetical protein
MVLSRNPLARFALSAVWLLLAALPAFPADPDASPAAGGPTSAEQTLRHIRAWVAGQYDNSTQAAQDLANPAIPDDEKHRVMHQLFVPVPVEVPAIPGYLVYQQSSVDGSEDPPTIVRAGLLQFFVDEAGQVHQRELNFKDLDAFKNAHRDPERLKGLTLDQFRFDSGCDFLLTPSPSGREVGGPMRPGACHFFSKGLNKELTADDAVTIRPDEYWFLGRFVDETGKIMWGNASDQPVKLVRRPSAGDEVSRDP